MKLATERVVFWLPSLPPEVDIMERGAHVVYVVRPDEPIELVAYQIEGQVPVTPEGSDMLVLEDLCVGHRAFHEREGRNARP